MSKVKWIKIATDIFDNEKIKLIESMPEGDAIIVVWFKILSLAGNINEGGYIFFTKDIPYTEQMLSTLFNRPVSTIQLALNTFTKFKMIDIVDDFIHVSNWEKYQNVEGLDRIREQTRIRVQKFRTNHKLPCNVTSNVTVTHGNALEEEGEEEREEDIDKDINITSTKVDVCTSSEAPQYVFQDIVDKWNTLNDLGIPKIYQIPENSPRVPKLRKRLKEYGKDSFDKIIDEIRNSDFLQGKTASRGRDPFNIDFDWVIGPKNYPKVLEGKYRNKGSAPEVSEDKYADYE